MFLIIFCKFANLFLDMGDFQRKGDHEISGHGIIIKSSSSPTFSGRITASQLVNQPPVPVPPLEIRPY